jgi:hypothetical protein
MFMNRLTARFPLFLSALLIVGLTATACKDETATQIHEDPVRIDPGPGPNPPPAQDGLVLSLVGDSALSGDANSVVPLRVKLTTRQDLSPVADEIISYQIISRQGGQEATLVSAQVLTNAQGEARNDVQLGMEGGELTIRATHEVAGHVEWTVSITPITMANLRVAVVNERPEVMELRNVDVRLYRGQHFDCSMFMPFANQPAALQDANLETLSRTALFRNLDARDRYTLTALARGERDQIAASGCVESIVLDPDTLNDETIVLELIPLIATGRYDVISYWDMRNVLAESGPVGASIVALFAYFENPGLALYNAMINQLYNWLSFEDALLLELALDFSGLDTSIQNTINNFINNNQVLSQIRQIGLDLRDTVAMLKVDSILTISKASPESDLFGEDDWFGLTFYWRRGCDLQVDPDCGQIRIGVGHDNDLGIAGSEWEGRVVDYDQLEIDDHMMHLNYGRVIMHVLNQVIIPGMTNGNANSLSQAFAYWIGCGNVAQSLAGIIGVFVNIPAAALEQICQATVSIVFASVENMVNNLSYPLDLYVSGTGHLLSDDGDPAVNRIEDGTFSGYIQRTDGSASTPATATWSGVRIDGP